MPLTLCPAGLGDMHVRISAHAEDRVAGDLNLLKDARIVIAMMRARLSAG